MDLPVLRPTRWTSHTYVHAPTRPQRSPPPTHKDTCTWSYTYASALGLPAVECNSVQNFTVRTEKWYFMCSFIKYKPFSEFTELIAMRFGTRRGILHLKLYSNITVSFALVQYNLPHFTLAQNVTFIFLTNGSHTGGFHFMSGLHSWKTSPNMISWKSKTKFPFKTIYFLGVRGLTSSYLAYDYTTSGHTDL